MIRSTIPITIALQAPTEGSAVTAFAYAVKRMSKLARHVIGISRHTKPPMDVFLAGDRFKMSRINAAANAAKMIELQMLWNRTYKKFVHEAMGHLSMGIDDDFAIPIIVIRPSPQPTSAIRFRCDQSLDLRGQSVNAVHAPILTERF